MTYLTSLTSNQKFILSLCLICFIYGTVGVTDGFLSSNVKGYILGLLSCASIVTIATMTLAKNKRADLNQVQSVIEENKADIYIDGHSLRTGDVYVNHGNYISKKENK